MKKLLAGIMAVGYLFQMTAFADTLDEMSELLTEEYTSATVSFEMSYELDKPMDFLGELQKSYDEEYYSDINPLDYQVMAESFFDSTADMTLKLDSSEDFKKMDMEVLGDFSVPVQPNENWKITGDMSFGIWMSADFTSMENLKYEMTVKIPFSRKYIFFDLAKLIEDTGAIVDDAYFNEEFVEEISQQSKELLKKSFEEAAEVKKQGSKYIITFDNDGVLSFVEKYFGGTIEIVKGMKDQYGETGFLKNFPEDAFDMPEEVIKEAEKFRKLRFLGEKGIVVEIDTIFGKISDINAVCDFDINIYDVLTTFEQDIPEFITKENSSISFLAKYDYNYSSIGSTTVTFPELTEDNCIYINEESVGNSSAVIEEDYSWYNGEEYLSSSAYGLAVEGPFAKPYLAIRDVMEEYAVNVSHYQYNYSDNIEVLWDNGIVTINDRKDLLPFDSVVLNSLTDEAFVDGAKLELPLLGRKHILVKGGKTFVSPELLNALIGGNVVDYNIYFTGDGNMTGVYVYFEFLNPNYTPTSYDA